MRSTLIAGLVAIVISPVAADARGTGAPPTLERSPNLMRIRRAPAPLAPQYGSTFRIYPRETTVSWAPLPNATSYVVEVEYLDPSNGKWFPEDAPAEVYGATTYTFYFVGGQPGRWRVQGVDRFGNRTAFSKWWTFEYTH